MGFQSWTFPYASLPDLKQQFLVKLSLVKGKSVCLLQGCVLSISGFHYVWPIKSIFSEVPVVPDNLHIQRCISSSGLRKANEIHKTKVHKYLHKTLQYTVDGWISNVKPPLPHDRQGVLGLWMGFSEQSCRVCRLPQHSSLAYRVICMQIVLNLWWWKTLFHGS